MAALARLGDKIEGGVHCHGHDHGPRPTPGRITQASGKVFVRCRPVARAGDKGHSPKCCAGVGDIVVQQSQGKVFVEGRPAASKGTPTVHCGMAPGVVAGGCDDVQIP